MRRIRVAEPEPAADELQRSLNALHSIGQQAARLEQMATTVSSNSASRTNLFESSQYQPAWGEADLPASAWGEDADAYRGHIEARAGARSPTPDHMRGRVTYDDDDDDDDDEEEEEEEADYHEPMPADDAMQAEARQLAHEQLDELFAEDEFNLPLLLWLMAGLSQEASPAERAKGAEAAEHLLGALSLANGPEALPGADELEEEEEELDMERLPLAMVQHMCLRKGMDASGSRQQLIDRLEQRELQERFEEMGHPRAVAPPQPPPAAATAADWQQRAAAAAAAAAAAGAAARGVPAIQIHTPPIALDRGGEVERAPLSPLEEEAREAAPTPSPSVGALPRRRPEALQDHPEAAAEDCDSAPSSPSDRPKSARGRPGADPFHYVSPSRVRPGAGGDGGDGGDDEGDGGDGGDGEAGRPKTARGRGGDPFGYVSPSRTRDGGQTTQRLDLDPEAPAFVPGGGGGFSAAMLAAARAEAVEGEDGSPVSSAYSSPVLVERPGDQQPPPQPLPPPSAAERLGSRAAQYLAGGGGGGGGGGEGGGGGGGGGATTQRREAAAAAGDDFDDINDFDDARDFFDARAGFAGTGMARNYAAAAAAVAAAATDEDFDAFNGALKAAMAGARDDDDSDSDDDDDDDDDQEGDDVALSAADLRQISKVRDQVPSLAQLRARLEQARREEGIGIAVPCMLPYMRGCTPTHERLRPYPGAARGR
jgi:hypothetical protein